MKHRLSRTWQLKQTHRLSGAWHWQLKHIHISVRNEDVHTEHVNNTSMSTLTQRMRMPIQNMSTTPVSQHLHRGWGCPYRTCQQHQQVNTYTEDKDAHTAHVNNTSKSTLTQRIIMPIQNKSTPASQHLQRGWGCPYRTCQHQQFNTYIHTEHVNNISKSTLT